VGAKVVVFDVIEVKLPATLVCKLRSHCARCRARQKALPAGVTCVVGDLLAVCLAADSGLRMPPSEPTSRSLSWTKLPRACAGATLSSTRRRLHRQQRLRYPSAHPALCIPTLTHARTHACIRDTGAEACQRGRHATRGCGLPGGRCAAACAHQQRLGGVRRDRGPGKQCQRGASTGGTDGLTSLRAPSKVWTKRSPSLSRCRTRTLRWGVARPPCDGRLVSQSKADGERLVLAANTGELPG
jgi:hypothetical protein